MSAHKKRAKADSEARTYGAAIALFVGVAAIFFYAFAHPSPGALFVCAHRALPDRKSVV